MSFKIELKKLTEKLRSLPKAVDEKTRKKIMGKSARVLINAARNNIKDSAKPHKRYSGGQVAATYYPGNLRRSIQILRSAKFRKSSAVFVGPKFNTSGATKGEFKGRRVDAYYAHMVEFGTSKQKPTAYMRKAVNSTRNQIANEISGSIKKEIDKWIRRNSI